MKLRSILVNWRMLFSIACGTILMALGIATMIITLCEPATKDYARIALSIILVIIGDDILSQRKQSLSFLPAISR